MKIIILLKNINERFPTSADKNRAIERLFNKSNDLNICNLDLALIFVASTFQFKYIDARAFFAQRPELIDALIDSSYAKYFAPDQFQSDLITVDDEQRRKDVADEIVSNLINGRIVRAGIDAINNHELLNSIDVNDLGIIKTNVVNVGNNVQIQIRGNDIYSFALSQTNYNIINDVILTNTSDIEIRDSRLIIRSEPSFLEFSDIAVPLLNPHQPISVSEFNVKPNLSELINVKEKTIGSITVALMHGEDELVTLTKQVSFLSYDTWIEHAMDASSALFVTPNDVAVKNIISLTSVELQKLTGEPTISGYQSGDKKDVAMQIKALYNTLFNYGIAYINPPASFEWVGQKIRFPHDVIVNKQGTCLDLAILFAACIENMGMNPFIVLIRGHAFAGVFLEENGFPSSVYFDASKVAEMNSEQENELLLFECTNITIGSKDTFEESCAAGRRHILMAESDPDFKIIDIQKARSNGFLPLPIDYDDIDRVKVNYEVAEQNKTRLVRKSYDYKGEKIELSEAELNKFDVWEKKLLDLSKRNQLVNYKPTGKGLQIFYYDLNDLYDAFKEGGKRFSIYPHSNTESFIFELPEATEDAYRELKNGFENKRLGFIIRSQAQNSSLRFFERERRKSFEETGSNIFYLALGFIKYFENSKSVVPCYAPIILVPINLIKNSKDNYSIEGREEPPFLNISAFEFFHQEFGMNFDDLLSKDLFDDETINVDSILNTVSEKLKKLNRASIVRAAALNIFNFSKAVMWSDVKFRREDLIKNKVIKSIINKKYIFESDDELETQFDDSKNDPSDFAIPLPADSSQIIAIKDCAEGKSFILQGPPGTGKSQTITNMIVNAIYHGKTVLFVAEKMAALDVVRKRLSQLCLEKFALEAHSTKADKASLMSQFEERVALGATSSTSEDYLLAAQRIKEERKELNKVIDLLHRENDYFLSFYDAFVNYLDIDEDVHIIDIDDDYVANLYTQQFKEASRLCDKLNSLIIANGGYINNPFIMYRNANYISGKTRREFEIVIRNYQKAINQLLAILDEFNINNGLKIESDCDELSSLIKLLKNKKTEELALLNLIDIDFESIDSHISEICYSGSKFQKDIATIRENFNDNVFSLNAELLINKYNALSSAFFIKKSIGINKIYKEIKTFSKNAKGYSKHSILDTLNLLKLISDNEKWLAEQTKKYQAVFGSFNGVNIKDYNFEEFAEKYSFTKEMVNECSSLLGVDCIKTLVSKLQCYSLQKRSELLNAFNEVSNVEKALINDYGFDFSYRNKLGLTYNSMVSFIDQMLLKLDFLSSWCTLLSTIKECENNDLDFIIDYIEREDNLPFNLEFVYKKSVFSHIMARSLAADGSTPLNVNDLEYHLDYYQKLISQYKELTIKETAAKVSSRMPSIRDNSPASSQQGILNRAIKNKCRGKAIRQLFAEIPDILTKIFPVFLMSPMSCAQYLSSDMPKFDIVIFDEASQMPTSEAIGAIARGNSLIVVGDSMQMPPTSFFKSKGSDDLDVDLDDQESILDDCVVIGMPSRCLNWHYRSKHESLIRFSNAKFYGNNLITFPSPNDRTTKVSFVNAHGVYGGKRATNEIEAKAIIKEIERRLKSPDLRKRSIGVVTFSSVQQEVIDDMLQDFFASHKDLEKINLECNEPIIVKNLENIQGDERDVILFSICYGPDKNGIMYHRFGPINSQGGEKRLNVAVSRARYEMIVFASFEPEILSNMKTESVGAKELYSFLKYAKDGPNALVVPNGNVIENKIGFEKKLAQQIESKGYDVEIDVGKSSFKVDIAVINPDKKNEYILGVLCDSYSYQSAMTARDRNIVQPTTLKLLGWNVFRVWSFDYFDNPKQVVDTICNLVEDIRLHPENYNNNIAENQQMEIEFETQEVQELKFSRAYVPYTKVHNIYGTSDDNYSVKKQLILEIMEKEAPISEEVLRNRFANAMGVSRAGSNIQSDMFVALKAIHAKKNSNFNKTKVFFWLDGQSQNLDYYRVGGPKPRDMDDVPKEEIFVAIKEILLNNGPIFKEELKRYVAKAFDIKAVGRKVDVTIEDCVEYYKAKGELVMIDGNSRLALKSQRKE